MKQAWAIKWIEALRNGNYKQTRSRLKRGNAFCCLGVLCDISKQGRWIPDTYLVETEGTDAGGYFATTAVPEEVMKLTGMKSNVGDLITVHGSLASINDFENKSLEEIADIIEMFWEEL